MAEKSRDVEAIYSAALGKPSQVGRAATLRHRLELSMVSPELNKSFPRDYLWTSGKGVLY